MSITGQRTVTKIEANPLLVKNEKIPKLIRVAAYCRVSTDEEEQLNSYEAQIAYYTDAISKNPQWTFAGIYADEGITGTSTAKRKDFLRLMRDCQKGKIDYILTKSVSRFARNTVDSLSWVRKLRAMNIGVYFEEQAIDSLKAENEMLIGLFSVIAQAESENISGNVKWGINQRMKNGNFRSNFSCYGYRKGENGIPEIIPEQAEVVRIIYDRYLDGQSVCQIADYLNEHHYPTRMGKMDWQSTSVGNILKNEKYSGDLILQKTYTTDPISKKKKVNHGEMPKYLVTDNHPAIIERTKFNRVQMEIARRGNTRKKSTQAKTELGKYSGKYTLSELLICGECGSHYRRREKSKHGKKQYVWRCINRMENGSERCGNIGAEEEKLHRAICKCLNNLFSDKTEMMKILRVNLQYAISGSDSASEIASLESEVQKLNADIDFAVDMLSKTGGETERYLIEIENNTKQLNILREKLNLENAKQRSESNTSELVDEILKPFEEAGTVFEKYDDSIVRRLVECIRINKDRRITVVLKGGLTAETVLE